MSDRETRTLFSVIEVIRPGGHIEMELEWHPSLYSRLDEIAPGGEFTDRILDLASEIMADINGDDEQARD